MMKISGRGISPALAVCALAGLWLNGPALAGNPQAALPSAFLGVPQFYCWGGAYMGIAGNYTLARDQVTANSQFYLNSPFERWTNSRSGEGGVVEAGYNFQMGSFVFGPQVAAGWLGADGNKKSPFNPASYPDPVHMINPTGTEARLATRFYGTATGRLGYAFGQMLVYGKAGVAVVDAGLNVNIFNYLTYRQIFARGRENRIGGTVGGGLEYAFTERLSAKAEYSYLTFQKSTYYATNVFTPALLSRWGWSHSLDAHVLSVGLNYRFWSM